MTFTFDGYLPLLHKTQVSEELHRSLLLPCLPSPSSLPSPQGCWLAKVCFTGNVIYTKEIDLIPFKNLLGYYHAYLLYLALIAQFQDAAGSKQDCSKLLGSKLRFCILNCLLTQSCSADLFAQAVLPLPC